MKFWSHFPGVPRDTRMSTRDTSTLQDNALLTPVLSLSLRDVSHDWRLLPLVSTQFLAAWKLHNVEVLTWRVAFLERTVASLQRTVEDFRHECSCGCAVGFPG